MSSQSTRVTTVTPSHHNTSRRLIPDATCPRCKPSRSPEPNCLPESSLSIRSQPTKPAAPALHFGSNQVGHLFLHPLRRSSCSAHNQAGHLLLNINNAAQLEVSQPPPRFTSAPIKPATSFSTSTTRRSSEPLGRLRASLRLQPSRPPLSPPASPLLLLGAFAGGIMGFLPLRAANLAYPNDYVGHGAGLALHYAPLTHTRT